MSHNCRKCLRDMPADREGWEQVCARCNKLDEVAEKIKEIYYDTDFNEIYWEKIAEWHLRELEKVERK